MRSWSGNRRGKRNRTPTRRERPANRIRKLGFERCERRELLAEITLNSVNFIETDNLSTFITPIVGERVCIRAGFSTSSLPAGSSYRIEFNLDGVIINANSVTTGVATSGNWFYFQCGWFASPGQHSAQVILDADNAIAETNESNNTLATPRVFTAVAPTTLPQKFVNPLGGVPFHDWRFSAYVDVDPSSSFRDFQGGTIAYDGHLGQDIGVVNFARMDHGIPEYAAADGVVEQMQDGNFDRNDTRGSRPANFIVINHGNGWRTRYYHLMANSITVSVGDTVKAGQFLGLAGSSGDSNGPHLHFEVTHNGNSVESKYSPSDYYVNPLGYQGSQPTYVLDAVVSNASPTSSDFDERPGEHTTFSTQNLQSPVITFWISSVPAGERVDLIEYRPDGTVNSTNTTLVVGPINSGSYWWRPPNSALSANPGTWRFAIVKNGVELASRSFVVTTGPGVPQIRVTQSTSVIADNRTTAVDFGSVAAGGAAPRQSFTINNTGTSPLLLSNLRLPSGFVLSGNFPASISAGASSTINVDLATTVPGSKFGAIQFSTNDPDTPTFNFHVSGTVTGTAPAAAPVVSLVGPALAYTKLGQEMPLKPAALLTDTDSATFAGGTFTAEFTSQGSGADQLGIANVGSGAGQIGVSGNTVTFGGVNIATFTGGSAGSPLAVSFNAAATRAAVQALLRNVTFRTTTTKVENLSRYVRFSLTDDTGNLSNQPIAVVAQNLYPTTISLDSAGNLLIADSSVSGKDDIWKLERSGDNLKLTDLSGYFIDASSIPGSTGNVSSVVTIPLAALSPDGQVVLDTRGGSDSLTVDLSAGDPIPAGGLNFSGGDPTLAPGDKLTIVGGDQGTVTYNYTNAHDGSIVMSNFGTIAYTGLEPIVNTGAATDIVFNLPAGTNAVTLADDGTIGNSISRLSATTFEQTDFANPSGTLSINRGSNSDTLTISALPDFNVGLTIGSPNIPFGSVTFAANLVLANDKDLSVTALGPINLPNSLSDLKLGGTGSMFLTTAQSISLSAGASLGTSNGAISLTAAQSILLSIASVTSANGPITMLANQQELASPGDFSGISIDRSLVSVSGTGDLTLKGRGGNSDNGSQRGVVIFSSGIVSGGISGTVTVDGTGGSSAGDFNDGVRIAGISSQLTSIGANIVVIGRGGTAGTQSRGVSVEGARISPSGSGTLTITGVGGPATSGEAQGILVTGATSFIFSTNSDISLDGRGGGIGTAASTGGVVAVGGFIQAGGSGKLTIIGTAGNPDVTSNGVELVAPAKVSTSGGDLEITGIPVNSTAMGITIAAALTAGSTGSVRLTADRLNIPSGGLINLAQSVRLLPLTPGLAIDLGGIDTESALAISDSELDLIAVNYILVGNPNSGPISISAAVNRPNSTFLSLASGDVIQFTGGSIDAAGGNLLLLAFNHEISPATAGVDVVVGPGTLLFANKSVLAIDLNGTVADTQYDQLQVAGNIDLTGLTLSLSGTYSPRIGESFTIVNNLGANSVAGEFSGLADGKAFQISVGAAAGYYVIDYHGGDGNDVIMTRVNLLPAFDSIADPSPLDEDSPAQLLLVSGVGPGFGHNIFSFTATSNAPTLIPNPQIEMASPGAMASLRFQPVTNQYGMATITVTLQDDGGAKGRIDTITRTFTVTVAPINDPPSFTYLAGNWSALDENPQNHGPASAQSVPGWATSIFAGAVNEASQKLLFDVTNDNHKLFAVQPALSDEGTLTYTPAPNARGVANVMVVLQDDGDGVNAAAPVSFQIEITKPHPLHNSRDSGVRSGLDVTGTTSVQPDGAITAGDVLAVINYINAKGSGTVAANTLPGPPYPDVNADDQVIAEDVLKIINYINANPVQSEGFDILPASATTADPIDLSVDLMNLLAADSAAATLKRRRSLG